jgi:hypothetical protein
VQARPLRTCRAGLQIGHSEQGLRRSQGPTKVKKQSKVKLPHYSPCRRLGGEEVHSSYLFLYLGVSGQRHAPAALCPRYHCTVGWVGFRGGLDTG